MARHVSTILAYPIKVELGGGYRGVFFVHSTKERRTSEVFQTLEAARFWAKSQAEHAYADVGYSLAPLRRRGEYRANVWVA